MVRTLLAAALAFFATGAAAAPIAVNFHAPGISGWVGLDYPPTASNSTSSLIGGRVTLDGVRYDVTGFWNADIDALNGFGQTIIHGAIAGSTFQLSLPGTDPTSWVQSAHESGTVPSLLYTGVGNTISAQSLALSYSVPEPVTLVLLGVGALSVGLRRRRRCRALRALCGAPVWERHRGTQP